jgi:hypothetical protein
MADKSRRLKRLLLIGLICFCVGLGCQLLMQIFGWSVLLSTLQKIVVILGILSGVAFLLTKMGWISGKQ